MTIPLDSWAVLCLLDGTEPAASRVEQVLAAAAITADHPLASADAFAAATAVYHDATLLTGDPELLIARAPWRWEDLRDTTGS